ncbi:MAG: hypothetical protein IPG32_15205 [Saprospirales bacterium]|nr:hypothetical protein [Saprospirales bacterium]
MRTLLPEEQLLEGEKDEAILGTYRTSLRAARAGLRKDTPCSGKNTTPFSGCRAGFHRLLLDEVKRILAAENAFLLEYFHGNKSVYALCVHPGGLPLHPAGYGVAGGSHTALRQLFQGGRCEPF